MAPIKRLVLDVLKPHDPKMIPFCQKLCELETVTGTTAKLVDIEEEVRTIRLTLEGEDLDFEAVEERVRDLSGSIHSIDEVSCGEEVVEDPWVAE